MVIELKAAEHGCEEASPMSVAFYVPCNRPAKRRVFMPRDKREYRMCEMCANHNLRRNGEDRGEYLPSREEGRS